jgi:uncharacterized protein (DUF2132 family)
MNELAQSCRIRGMIAFDETMVKIANHCRKMLAEKPEVMYKHIEDCFFGPDATPSPLLKYYNDITQTTKFTLPPRVRLETDLELFKKTLTKIKHA